MKRIYECSPAYDCIAHPCGKNGCGTEPGRSHGRHCDTWRYTVVDDDGRFAVTLSAWAGNFPGGPQREPCGVALSTHVDPRDSQRGRSHANTCYVLPFGECVADATFTYGEEFFKTHGDPTYVQRESFWRALESELQGRRGR